MSSWLSSWRVALRISRRQVRRNKARSALIVLMLALPVFGSSLALTLLNSADHLSQAERLTRAVGHADAFVSSYPPSYQDATAAANSIPVQDAPGSYGAPAAVKGAASGTADALRKILPQAKLYPETSSYVFAQSGGQFLQGDYYQADFAGRLLDGAFDLVSGRYPQGSGEIDLTPAAAAALHVTVGGQVTLPAMSTAKGERAEFTVAGLMQQPDATHDEAMFASPEAPAGSNQSGVGWFVQNPGGVAWPQVEELDASGLVSISRDVVLDPPPASQVPYDRALAAGAIIGLSHTSANDAVVGTIAVGVALLEVVLLAGPAFAVSARRREREFAVIGAAGADIKHLRRIVLADGIVLGLVGGAAGALLGFGAAAAMLPFGSRILGKLPGTVQFEMLPLLGVVVVAMLLGLAAAAAPARSVARRDILAALQGRTRGVRTRIRVFRLAIGLVLVGVGMVGILFGQDLDQGFAASFAIGGVALAEIGALMCIPAIIVATGRLGRILPLGPRLALRESARHTGRTTPAVAAMLAAVAGAVAVGCWSASSDALQGSQRVDFMLANQSQLTVTAAQAKQVQQHLNALPGIVGDVVKSPFTPSPHAPDGIAIQTVIVAQPGAPASSFAAASANGTCDTGAPAAVFQFSQAQLTGLTTCGAGSFPSGPGSPVIETPAQLGGVLGYDDAAADAVLNEGGLVTSFPGVVQNGKVQFVLQGQTPTGAQRSVVATLPGYYLAPGSHPQPGTVLSPATAHRFGLDGAAGSSVTMLLDWKSSPTPAQLYAVDNALIGMSIPQQLQSNASPNGMVNTLNLIVLLAASLLEIGAAAIATGLALADGRSDQDTLTAVGAAPWTRRLNSGSTALAITGLGTVIGVPLGILIAAGLIRSDGQGLDARAGMFEPGRLAMHLVLPWLDLGMVVLAVPAATALGAVLLTRSRTPRMRRIEV